MQTGYSTVCDVVAQRSRAPTVAVASLAANTRGESWSAGNGSCGVYVGDGVCRDRANASTPVRGQLGAPAFTVGLEALHFQSLGERLPRAGSALAVDRYQRSTQ